MWKYCCSCSLRDLTVFVACKQRLSSHNMSYRGRWAHSDMSTLQTRQPKIWLQRKSKTFFPDPVEIEILCLNNYWLDCHKVLYRHKDNISVFSLLFLWGTIFEKLFCWFPWNLVWIFMVPRGWILTTLVIPWLLFFTYPVKCIKICRTDLDILHRNSWLSDDESKSSVSQLQFLRSPSVSTITVLDGFPWKSVHTFKSCSGWTVIFLVITLSL